MLKSVYLEVMKSQGGKCACCLCRTCRGIIKSRFTIERSRCHAAQLQLKVDRYLRIADYLSKRSM